MSNARSYTGGHFMLALDGMKAGYLQSVSGAAMQAELVSHKMGPASFEKKNVTTRKWTPIKAKVGGGMSKGLYEWMRSAFDMNVLYKTGSITVADFNYKAQRRLDFMNALITKFTMPTLDAASKDTFYAELEFLPEQARWFKESGSDVRGDIGPKQKAWHTANWRVSFGDLPCGRVNKIEGIGFECKTELDHVGQFLEHSIHPVATTVSSVTLSISMADLDPWAQAADDWFIKGNCEEANERTMIIEMLAPDRQKVLGTYTLGNCGFEQFDAQGKLEAHTNSVARFTTKIYAETIKFDMNYTDA